MVLRITAVCPRAEFTAPYSADRERTLAVWFIIIGDDVVNVLLATAHTTEARQIMSTQRTHNGGSKCAHPLRTAAKPYLI